MATVKELRAEVSAYKKKFDNWHRRADEILKRYRDDDLTISDGQDTGMWGKYRLNILYSNVQTTTPTLYARTPKPVVERKFKDRDPVALVAAEVAERAAECLAQKPFFDETLKGVVKDLLLPGRGTSWVMYKAEFSDPKTDPVIDQGTGQPLLDEDGKPIPRKIDERVWCEVVPAGMFGHNCADAWNKVQIVWRIVELTKKEAKERFGEKAEKLAFLKIDRKLSSKDPSEQGSNERARIVELWNKEDRKVYWFEERGSGGGFLDVQDDPLQLDGFFPCPRPLFSCLTTDSLVPISDFSQYKSLSDTLDKLCLKRINLLEAIRTVGARSGAHDDLDTLLSVAEDLKLVPIRDWATWVEKGGLKGLVDFMPIEPQIKALAVVDQEIEKVKQEIYEVTGIADIVRGNTSPSETATAQQIKGQFATLRIQERQRDVQIHARDLLHLMTELVVEQFDDEKIAAMINLSSMPEQYQASFGQALGLLRNDKLREYRIDIETDSTIAVDEQQEKASRMEFVQTVGQLINNTNQAIMGMPAWAGVFSEILMLAVRGFRAGRGTEFAIEQALAQVVQQAMQPQQPPPPDPAMVKVQQDGEIKAAEMQAKREQSQVDAQIKTAQIQVEREKIAQKDSEARLKAELEEKNLIIKQLETLLKATEPTSMPIGGI